jgi:hypothetical protein
MISAHCASCQRVTGHKRALGWGTFFAAVLTLGVWLFAIPFYSKRCMICGTMAPRAEKSLKRTKGLLLILVAIVVLLWLIGKANVYQSPTTRTAETVIVPPKLPRLVLTVQQASYERGYVKILGVAKNTGAEGARNPTIKLSVFDSPAATTLLAESTTWPAGRMGKTMDPGSSAAFEFFASVPGSPDHIRWRISVDDGTPYEVVMPPAKAIKKGKDDQ